MRRCGKCKQNKPLHAFNKSKTGSNGYYFYCRGCASEVRKLWYTKNKTKRIRQTKEYASKNSEKYKILKHRWYENNKTYFRAHCANYEKKNPELRKSIAKKYYSSPRGLAKARNQTAKRRARKLRATPPWLTSTHLKEIEAIYKNCPKGFHVDHIVPLQGKNVCGLHVPWNLNIVSAKENLTKGNKLILNSVTEIR
jgi:hypothetical protein